MNNKTICGVKISNPEKVIYGNIKKIDIVNYYSNIYKLIYPFLQNRPLSEIRCHGDFSKCFFKKHPINGEKYITVSSKAEFINEVQLGTLEFHPFSCLLKSNKLTTPNIMIFDLDPDEKLSIKTLQQGVIHLKSVLDQLNLTSYLKVSGGKGYHVVVPFGKVKSWQVFEKFAHNVALLMENKWPNLYTTSIKKADRKDKIFVDYLRNKKGATCVAPYSLRCRDNLPISLPIAWEDLSKFKPNKVNLKNYKKYLNPNAWKDFFSCTQKLN